MPGGHRGCSHGQRDLSMPRGQGHLTRGGGVQRQPLWLHQRPRRLHGHHRRVQPVPATAGVHGDSQQDLLPHLHRIRHAAQGVLRLRDRSADRSSVGSSFMITIFIVFTRIPYCYRDMS